MTPPTPASAAARRAAGRAADRVAVFGLATTVAYALLALATRVGRPPRDLALAHLAEGVPLFERTAIAAFFGAGAALAASFAPEATSRLLARRGTHVVVVAAALAALQAALAP